MPGLREIWEAERQRYQEAERARMLLDLQERFRESATGQPSSILAADRERMLNEPTGWFSEANKRERYARKDPIIQQLRAFESMPIDDPDVALRIGQLAAPLGTPQYAEFEREIGNIRLEAKADTFRDEISKYTDIPREKLDTMSPRDIATLAGAVGQVQRDLGPDYGLATEPVMVDVDVPNGAGGYDTVSVPGERLSRFERKTGKLTPLTRPAPMATGYAAAQRGVEQMNTVILTSPAPGGGMQVNQVVELPDGKVKVIAQGVEEIERQKGRRISDLKKQRAAVLDLRSNSRTLLRDFYEAETTNEPLGALQDVFGRLESLREQVAQAGSTIGGQNVGDFIQAQTSRISLTKAGIREGAREILAINIAAAMSATLEEGGGDVERGHFEANLKEVRKLIASGDPDKAAAALNTLIDSKVEAFNRRAGEFMGEVEPIEKEYEELSEEEVEELRRGGAIVIEVPPDFGREQRR